MSFLTSLLSQKMPRVLQRNSTAFAADKSACLQATGHSGQQWRFAARVHRVYAQCQRRGRAMTTTEHNGLGANVATFNGLGERIQRIRFLYAAYSSMIMHTQQSCCAALSQPGADGLAPFVILCPFFEAILCVFG